jgi:hypothetical protein
MFGFVDVHVSSTACATRWRCTRLLLPTRTLSLCDTDARGGSRNLQKEVLFNKLCYLNEPVFSLFSE